MVILQALQPFGSGGQSNCVDVGATTPTNEPPAFPQSDCAEVEPGFSLSKTLTAPLGRAAQVGEIVSFDIQISNTGNVDMLIVPLDDMFDDAVLDFTNAIPAPDSTGVGLLSWTNLGPLAVGATTNVTVNFMAEGSTTGDLNQAIVCPLPPFACMTSPAPFRVSAPGYTLSKTLVMPMGRPALIGETVVFDITINNTGTVDLVTVPVTDTFDLSSLAFQSAAPVEDAVIGNVITWTDVGPVVAGSSTSLMVSFTATASTMGAGHTNRVETSPTTPPTEPPVPPMTNDEPYQVEAFGYTLTKTLTAPTSGVAVISNSLTFTITIVNTGEVTLATVPVTDTYDATFIQFTNAAPAADSAIPGLVMWNDIGPLTAGASTTIVVNFLALTN
ncbi:MAG: hypothetical protein AAF492_26120, partial [Verrucomicrobiota bacterium]